MRYAFIFSIVILFSSCKKEIQVKSSPDINVGKIAFQFEFINWAWGFQHITWFVDTNGVVRFYKSFNRNELWKQADDVGYISAEDFQFNYALCDTIVSILDSFEVRTHAHLIPAIDESMLSGWTNGGADGGSAALYCYVWNPVMQKYKRVFLAQTGDFERVNLNSNAVELTTWLTDKGEHEMKNYFVWF